MKTTRRLAATALVTAASMLSWTGPIPGHALAGTPDAAGPLEFRMPRPVSYRLDGDSLREVGRAGAQQWLKALPTNESTNYVELSSRVVLQLKDGATLKRITAGAGLELSRVVASNIFILQASDAWTAAFEAHRLARLPAVLASYPVMWRQMNPHGPYAYQPIDSFFKDQWPLEHRRGDRSVAGVDLNVRAAWPWTLGQGVTIAVADTGVEMAHPELVPRVAAFDYGQRCAGLPRIGGDLAQRRGTPGRADRCAAPCFRRSRDQLA